MNRAVAMQAGPGWRIAALVGLLCACACSPPPEPVPLRFGMDVWPGYFPAVLAERQGLMADHGVALEVVPTRDTKALLAEFTAGRYELVAVSLGDALTLGHGRTDLVVLLVADESAGGDQLLRAPGRAADAPPPHRYGTSLGGFGELFVRAWHEREGIDPRHVVWADVDASAVPGALAEGRIDFGHTWQPYAGEAVAAGATMVFSSAETPGLVLDVVLTTRAALERKPEALRGFARAWFIAAERWLADPPAGHAIAAEALGLDPAEVSLDGVKLYRLEDNHHAMAGGPDAPLAALIDRYADFFVERGSLSRPPEASTLFAPGLLPAATEPPP